MAKYYQLNERIRAETLRVITREGENLGVLSKEEALRLARERGKDLIVVAEKANPPVAKILDFKKFLYEQDKKAQQARAGTRKSELKEFKFSPSIDDGDLKMRIERSRKFLEKGNRVRLTIRMRGRENAYPELAERKLREVAEALADIARVEAPPKRKGNQMSITLVRKG